MSLRRAGLALLALSLVLTACPSGSGSGGPPVPGGILRVVLRDLSSLDPAKARGRGALLAVAQAFDSLTAIDPDTNVVVPAAAASWKVSRDGRTWTFTIGGSVFHDGRPVTAADFKFAFDRVARQSTGSDYAFQLEPVRGFREAKITGRADRLAGAEARGDKTLVIRLDRPYAELPVALAHPALAPLQARRYARGEGGLATRPVGNGPFRVESAAAGKQASLTRFDGYAGSTAFVDRVELTVVEGQQEGWRRFLDGRADVAEVPAESIESDRGRYGRDGFTSFWAAVYYGLNLREAKYAKPEVRRALALAIDREAIADVVYGGTKDPATGILPRGVRGFAPDACDVCALDTARARRILRAAFGSRGLSLAIDHLDASPSREVARAVAADLQEVGVRVSLRQHTPREYLRLINDRRHDVGELGWFSDVPSPDPFLAQQLRSESRNNPMRYSDRTFDETLDRARAEPDERKRLALYRRAERRALAQMPLIPLVFFRNHVAASGRVRAFVLDGAGLFDAAAVWLAR